tara:strand:+ start:240 stop:470 length:231 start_codon:yes stop_codon:yes gene_type:complete
MTVYSPFKKQLTEEEQKRQNQEVGEALGALLTPFIKAAMIMLIWNWLMPGLFGIATIGYLKALALYVLSRLLFDKA